MLLKAFLLFVLTGFSISNANVLKPVAVSDPCSRMPCQSDEICVSQSPSSFLCVRDKDAQQAVQQNVPFGNDEDLEILKNVVGGGNTQPQAPIRRPNGINTPIKVEDLNDDLTAPQTNQQSTLGTLDNDDEILKNVLNPSPVVSKPASQPFPLSPLRPTQQKIAINQQPNEDTEVLKNLLNQPQPVAPASPVLTQQPTLISNNPEDETILNNLINKPPISVPVLPQQKTTLNKPQEVNNNEDDEVLKNLLNHPQPPVASSTVVAQETNRIDQQQQLQLQEQQQQLQLLQQQQQQQQLKLQLKQQQQLQQQQQEQQQLQIQLQQQQQLQLHQQQLQQQPNEDEAVLKNLLNHPQISVPITPQTQTDQSFVEPEQVRPKINEDDEVLKNLLNHPQLPVTPSPVLPQLKDINSQQPILETGTNEDDAILRGVLNPNQPQTPLTVPSQRAQAKKVLTTQQVESTKAKQETTLDDSNLFPILSTPVDVPLTTNNGDQQILQGLLVPSIPSQKPLTVPSLQREHTKKVLTTQQVESTGPKQETTLDDSNLFPILPTPVDVPISTNNGDQQILQGLLIPSIPVVPAKQHQPSVSNVDAPVDIILPKGQQTQRIIPIRPNPEDVREKIKSKHLQTEQDLKLLDLMINQNKLNGRRGRIQTLVTTTTTTTTTTTIATPLEDDLDSQIIQNHLANPVLPSIPVPLRPELPVVQETDVNNLQPVEANNFKDDDMNILQNLFNNNQPVIVTTTTTAAPVQALNNFDDQIIFNMLNQPTTTTTTRRLPVQPIQPVLVETIDTQPINVPVQVPVTVAAFETNNQQIQDQPVITPSENALRPKLLDKLRGRSGLSNVKNLINEVVKPEPLPTTTSTTTLSPLDMSIIQNLMNHQTTTTTTRAPFGLGIQRTQVGDIKTDMRLLQTLRNRGKARKTNKESISVVPVAPVIPLTPVVSVDTSSQQTNIIPETKPVQIPSTQPVDIPKTLSEPEPKVVAESPLVNQEAESKVVESTTSNEKNKLSPNLREKLRGRSGIPATQIKTQSQKTNLAIDHLVKDAVDKMLQTSTTTTTTTTARREPYCLGQKNGEIIPHPEDRKKFIVCQVNDYSVMNCPATLIFNRYLGRCDRNDNEPPKACLSSPCRNDGTCTDTATYGFKCECKEGFTGTTCERNSDPCFKNPCSPFGACNSLEMFGVRSVKYYCLCSGGNSYGLHCDNQTFANPCLRLHTESYYPSELNPSLFIHCESDIMNMKACTEPLVWSQKILTCVTQDELEEQILKEKEEQEKQKQQLDLADFEFVEDDGHDNTKVEKEPLLS